MPEGPEIHRAADRIRNALEGKPLLDVNFEFQPIVGMEHHFEQGIIEKVEARGKALLIHGAHRVLYAHNQLYGRWMVNKKGRKLPGSRRSLRLTLESDSHVVRLFSATDVCLLEHHEVDQHPYIAKLGPDVVLKSTTAKDIHHHIVQKKYQRRQLGGLLLDQGFLSGVGNYLRSEILFRSGLRPKRTISSLTKEELKLFCNATIEIVQRAFEQKGITVSKQRYESLRAEGHRHGASRHYVFTRSGLPCYDCNDTILRETVASRRLDLCPSCQK